MALQFKNSQLANSSIIVGGVTLNLGDTDATPAFNLSDGTAYPGDGSLVTVGTIASGVWSGTAIVNAKVANDLTISGGTVDNSVVGGTTAAAGTFTTLVANTSITGTLATPAQANITSLGSLLGITLAASQTINMGNNKVTNVADPTANTDAATKSYVDANSQGLDVKEACRVATTANVTIASDLNVGDAIDGVTLADGDRVLLKNQTTGSQNGIYVAGASPARSTDLAAGDEASGVFCFIEEGTVNGDAGFVCTTDGPSDVVGTNPIAFTQFSGAGQVTAGDGLSKSGNTLSVVVDGSSIEINADTLRVKANGITNAMLAGSIADSNLSTIATANKVSGSAVQLAAAGSGTGGLQNSGGLQINLDGTTLALGASGISVNLITNAQVDNSAAIADTKLATIATANKVSGSAVQLSTNTALEDSTGLRLKAATAGNGLGLSAAQVMSVSTDGGTLTSGGSGIKITDLGVGSGQIANSAVTLTQIGFSMGNEKITTANASTSTMDLLQDVPATFRTAFGVQVFKNGQRLFQGNTADNSEYTLSSVGGKCRLTFGGNLENGDVINAVYVY